MNRDGGNVTAAAVEVPGQVAAPSPATRPRRAWRRALRRPPAFVGAAIVLLFVVAAVGAPWIAATDPVRTDWSRLHRHYESLYLFGPNGYVPEH